MVDEHGEQSDAAQDIEKLDARAEPGGLGCAHGELLWS